jgi:hypothetical protein
MPPRSVDCGGKEDIQVLIVTLIGTSIPLPHKLGITLLTSRLVLLGERGKGEETHSPINNLVIFGFNGSTPNIGRQERKYLINREFYGWLDLDMVLDSRQFLLELA